MKNKKLTYLLVCCAVAVWGIIFYRIFIGTEDEDQVLPVNHHFKAAYFNMIDHQHDPVTIDLDYDDPFSDVFTPENEPKVPVTGNPVILPIIQPLAKPQVNWSAVSYKGLAFNPKTKKNVAIISVNGNEAMLEEGGSANGVRFIKRTGDSVKLEYQHTIRCLSIK